MMYCLERKEPHVIPNILGNHSMPVHTYRWKQLYLSEDKEYLESMVKGFNKPEDYRIVEMPWKGQ